MASKSEGSESSNVTPIAKGRQPSSFITTYSTSKGQKRRKVDEGGGFSSPTSSACWCGNFKWNKRKICAQVMNCPDPFTVGNLLKGLDSDKYGSMTKDIEDLTARRKQLLAHDSATSRMVPYKHLDRGNSPSEEDFRSGKYGSVTKDIEDLIARRKQLLAHDFAANRMVPWKHLDGENSPSEEDFMKYGSVTKDIDELHARKKQLFGHLHSSNSFISHKHLDLEKYPSKEDLKSYPPAIPDIIDLEEDDEPPGNGAIVKSEPAEEIVASSWPLIVIDLDDEELENHKNLCPYEVADLTKPAENFLTKNVKDLNFAEDQKLRRGNFCHGGEKTDKGVIGCDQTFHVDDQVIDLDFAEDQKLGRGNFCHADGTELKKDGVIDCDQTFHVDDQTMNRNCAEDQKSRRVNCCHAGDTELKKDKGVTLGAEFDDEIVEDKEQMKASSTLANISEVEKDKGVNVGVEDDAENEEGSAQHDSHYGFLGNIWNEMAFALECSKDTVVDSSFDEHAVAAAEVCDHSFILKDDIGSVCRICGLIERGIETIIDYQFAKAKKNSRTYKYERTHGNDPEQTTIHLEGSTWGEHDCFLTEIAVHPRHRKLMRSHQVEGFNFLLRNLMMDDPGGCIMAHAPGSGKTFMIISFLQSFMAKYPSARPLIVLPRGILSTWKKEFQRWQVEDMPLYDFYSFKAEGRIQQLEVLKKWANERSILFLGYKQFASIVCDNDINKTTIACQDILLTRPSILILDEGHTPRNQDTDILKSLEKVQTCRKVVLSGTLYQNHVKEVFNVLNLVRPKFLKMEPSKSIKRRILSKVEMSSRKSTLMPHSDYDFYDMVERTLLEDEKFKRKVHIVQDLREMTSKVLHYYKGDFLEELPGLVDFTVFLKLSPRQEREVDKLKNLKSRFKISSEGSAVYVHPQLKTIPMNSGVKGKVDVEKIDLILETLDETEGVKAKFYLNLLQLCESGGEKLLVFSQYLLPLKFLERLTVKVKDYSVGKEIFVITGDSDSEIRDSSMEQFNTSSYARVFFGSIKACGEGISLVGASRIIVLDMHLNPSVTRQAIGRAFRPGQERKVYTYRLVASGSPEEEDHLTCFKKESIAKMWFEWNAYQGQRDFELETVSVNDCGDLFLEAPRLNEDVVSVCKR